MTVNSSTLKLERAVRRAKPSRGGTFGFIILGALIAFEAFNYSTTDFALADLLGDLSFLDVRWATILAIAFCGIDFAGIARLFTPQRGAGQPKETWYLFGAWLLAATMNAMLTWWGVAIAILSHQSLGGSVIDRTTMVQVVPVFVAIMVWLIRVLLIGSFSVMGERLFSQPRAEQRSQPPVMRRNAQPAMPVGAIPAQAAPVRGAPKPAQSGYRRSEPTYHPAAMSGRNQNQALSRK